MKRMWRAGAIAALLVSLAMPAIGQDQVDAYIVDMSFTLPTGPGTTAVKNKQVIGGPFLTFADAAASRDVARSIIDALTRAYGLQPVPRGWAPFSAGHDIRIVRVPAPTLSAAP